MTANERCDLAIVGGGLAGGLIALAARTARPHARILLIEAGATIGGNHIWSFFGGDLSGAARALVEPLVAQRWAGHEVSFPRRRRILADSYQSITSERLDAAVRAALPADAIRTGARVAALSPAEVVLEGGARIAAGGVIDARGAGDLSALTLGWQKFVGRLLRFERPHGLTRPVIMDAAVEQIDGYRFVYLLPFDAHRLFIEDTYYSDTPALDIAALGERIEGYAGVRGWRVAAIEREEAGALPVVLGGDFEALWRGGEPGVAKVGVRAGLFHPTTGYSLPDAARTALLVAGLGDWGGAALHDALHAHARALWDARGFYRLLDRMLFQAAEPGQRWRVLDRFYRLDAGLVGRFYAARSTLADKARILMGRPPVPLGRAIRALAA